MNIEHHLDDATVVAYASGLLSAPLSLVASMHIDICPVCRRRVQAAESLGGALLERQAADVTDGFDVDKAWTALDERITATSVAPAEEIDSSDPTGAELIHAWQQAGFVDLPWKRVTRMVSQLALPDFNTPQAWVKLFRFEPGFALPKHTHRHHEISLVLQGAYRDQLGHFAVGDVSDLDSQVHHQPKVIGDEPCIALIASEGHVRFRNPLISLGARLFGI